MTDFAAIFEATAGRAGDRASAFAARIAGRGVAKGARVLVAEPVGIELYVILAALWPPARWRCSPNPG